MTNDAPFLNGDASPDPLWTISERASYNIRIFSLILCLSSASVPRKPETGTVNLMAAGERLSPIAFVKRPLLLPAIPPWLRCEIGEASGGKSGGAGR